MFGTAVSIVGAVCGTLLTTAFDGSPNQKLLGAVIGAVVATLFSVTGPYLHLRAATGVVVTVVALLVTYGGVKATDRATGRTTFPDIELIAQPRPAPSPSSAPSVETCEGDLCISGPTEVALCADVGCRTTVTVANTGGRRLNLTEFELVGPGAAAFDYGDGCVNRELDPGRDCSFPISVVASPAGPADLVIHQNLSGPATRVVLTAGGHDDERPDLRMSTRASCTASPGGRGWVAIRTAVRNDGPGGFDEAVSVRVEDPGGVTRDFTTTVGDVLLNLPVNLVEAGGSRTVSVTVDPGDDVDEADETDNVRRIVVTQDGECRAV